ncbi:hypothetical protein Trichorick_00185 [Candidatus Trichorickettsia mobilis]|uniref:Lipoprotein n=1 Tax=Candidatus Trichorickettsia mobilis TaxID=1346319 RepID=A0ABZ0URP1_9RICK|nr:hypothetical protein Trichorick_00185 [Candidatus Trichorickettsia mobilis]
MQQKLLIWLLGFIICGCGIKKPLEVPNIASRSVEGLACTLIDKVYKEM